MRQTEILQLVSYGHTNDAIARKLFLSEDAIKTHLRGAFRTLGARGRTHAMRLCFERGVLHLDSY